MTVTKHAGLLVMFFKGFRNIAKWHSSWNITKMSVCWVIKCATFNIKHRPNNLKYQYISTYYAKKKKKVLKTVKCRHLLLSSVLRAPGFFAPFKLRTVLEGSHAFSWESSVFPQHLKVPLLRCARCAWSSSHTHTDARTHTSGVKCESLSRCFTITLLLLLVSLICVFLPGGIYLFFPSKCWQLCLWTGSESQVRCCRREKVNNGGKGKVILCRTLKHNGFVWDDEDFVIMRERRICDDI